MSVTQNIVDINPGDLVIINFRYAAYNPSAVFVLSSIAVVGDKWKLSSNPRWDGPIYEGSGVGICVANPNLIYESEKVLDKIYYCVFPTVIGWMYERDIKKDEA